MSSDEELGIKITADATSAKAGIEQTGEKLKDLNPAVREVLESFGELRKTFVEAFAVSEIAEFTEHMAELGEQAIRTSEMLGISVEEVQKLGFAARMVGGSTEQMSSSLLRLEANMAEAQDGTSKAAKAFAALGIGVSDLANKSPQQVIAMIADAFHGAADGMDKVAIARDLMGRGGTELIPLLNKGSEELKRLGEIANNTGSILSDFQAKDLEQTAQGITTLKASVEGLAIQMFEGVKPAIDAFIQGLTTLAQWLRVVEELLNVMYDFLGGVFLTAIAAVGTRWAQMGVEMANALNTAILKAQEVSAVLGKLVHGDLAGAVAVQNQFEQQIIDGSATAEEAIKHLGDEYVQLQHKIMGATQAAIENTIKMSSKKEKEGDKTHLHAPGNGKAGKEDKYDAELEDAKNLFSYIQTMGHIRLEDEKALDQMRLASGQITKQQELADLAAFTRREEDLDLEAANRELALYDKDTVEYGKLLEKKAEMAAKYNAKLHQIQAQAAQAQKQQWKQVTDSMNTAFSQMVNGVLQGTQTWRQAMGRMFDNIALKFIDDVVLKMVEKWAAGLAEQIGLTAAFNAVMAALGLDQATASVAISEAANKAKNIASVTADAAVAYAGTFANQAPLLGPGASVPAAAAYSAVMAVLPQASLAVGAWDLNHDMVAQLHQGEMVVPRNFADGIRGGGGIGGGDSYSINIHAIDTQTGANFLKNNAGVIAKTLSGQARKFNKNVPAWKS